MLRKISDRKIIERYCYLVWHTWCNVPFFKELNGTVNLHDKMATKWWFTRFESVRKKRLVTLDKGYKYKQIKCCISLDINKGMIVFYINNVLHLPMIFIFILILWICNWSKDWPTHHLLIYHIHFITGLMEFVYTLSYIRTKNIKPYWFLT